MNERNFDRISHFKNSAPSTTDDSGPAWCGLWEGAQTRFAEEVTCLECIKKMLKYRAYVLVAVSDYQSLIALKQKAKNIEVAFQSLIEEYF